MKTIEYRWPAALRRLREVNYQDGNERPRCRSCAHLETRLVGDLKSKDYHCHVARAPVDSTGICDRYERAT